MIRFANLVSLLALTAAGCGVSPIYSHEAPQGPVGAVSHRSNWTAYGELQHPDRAIDGDVNTAAFSEGDYAGSSVTIDLGKACLFNMVIIDHGQEQMGYCRTVALLVSMDGRSFRRVHSAPGTRRVTAICPLEAVLARYVRLQADVAGDRPWSLAEVYVR